MYFCSECHAEIKKSSVECPRCHNRLKLSFQNFEKREREIHDSVSKKIKCKYFHKKEKQVKNVFNYFNSYSKSNKKLFSNIFKQELEILKFKLISDIYLNNIKISNEKSFKRVILKYNGEFKVNSDKILEYLRNFDDTVGVCKFTNYYKSLLNEYNLNFNDGLNVIAYVINDLILLRHENESIKTKTEFHLKKYKSIKRKRVRKYLNQYYQYTGKNYFSKRFENIISINKFSVNKAFEIKKLVLEDVYSGEYYIDVRRCLNRYIHKRKKSNNKKKFEIEKNKRLGGKTRKYNDKRNNEFGILGYY